MCLHTGNHETGSSDAGFSLLALSFKIHITLWIMNEHCFRENKVTDFVVRLSGLKVVRGNNNTVSRFHVYKHFFSRLLVTMRVFTESFSRTLEKDF